MDTIRISRQDKVPIHIVEWCLIYRWWDILYTCDLLQDGTSPKATIRILYQIKESPQNSDQNPGFRGLEARFPPGFSRTIRNFEPSLSGKFKLLYTILTNNKQITDDRVVLISDYTQIMNSFWSPNCFDDRVIIMKNETQYETWLKHSMKLHVVDSRHE